MSNLRNALFEALDITNKVANSIIKKLNYIESSLILKGKSFDELKSYLDKTASYHSNSYDELDDEKKSVVLQKVWNKIHNVLGKSEEELSEEAEDLEHIIYDYLKTNYWTMYPLDKTAKELAQQIKNKK